MMQALLQPLQEMGSFEELTRAMKRRGGPVAISGCLESQMAHMIAGLLPEKGFALVVAENETKGRELAEDLELYDEGVRYYPPKDLIFYQADIQSSLLKKQRMEVLSDLFTKKKGIIVTTIAGCMEDLMPAKLLAESCIRISEEDELDLTLLRKQLIRLGYENQYQAQSPGQFAVRGGILDIFPLTGDFPVRIELFGDEVDSIKTYDPDSQRSLDKQKDLLLFPASQMILAPKARDRGIAAIKKEAKMLYTSFREHMQTEAAHRIKSITDEFAEKIMEESDAEGAESYLHYFYPETETLADYLPEGSRIFLAEPARLLECAKVLEEEFSDSMSHRLEKGYLLSRQAEVMRSASEIKAFLTKKNPVLLSLLPVKSGEWNQSADYPVLARSVNSYNNQFPLLVKDLQSWKKKGYRVILASPSRTRAQRIARDLNEEEIPAFFGESPDRILKKGEIMIIRGNVRRGFEYPMQKFLILSESDIFGKERKKKTKEKPSGRSIAVFNELNVGDYVIHENHGLGIYRGIEKIDVDHVTRDYAKIEYANGSNLYILATQMDALQKYASSDAEKLPKLNRLGGQEWNKTKGKVRGAVKNIASELVSLYARRERAAGFEYGSDTVWQREFEELFPFEETEDQLRAIEDVKKDMESRRVMDRLICGDVGFGKTEIAIRAAFKAVQENKQVVFLCPTTILAQQHYNTFTERMKDFPVRVDLLCRFRTGAEQKKTLADLKKGQVDILIGTHRALSKDVVFKDLGLLIIDEEQRFGVTHKERIKELKTDVDVLTLTATPIPRTMHMSLIGIRDMSILEEAPQDRLPIQTFVAEFNEEMVREAIMRELARDGQVYYVYNRVNTIADVAGALQKLVPDAVIAYAHGQMKERELEKIMVAFINGEIDVLVSTTIIETGLDISNVNTMIIHDADQLGLAQLYQLRGRVGRSNRTSYAFLLYRRNKMLKEVAEKRLHAIREFTEMGSGFKIAMRDLEIRGAGNLLGAEQSGHMEAVGYDLYCKMLNEAVLEVQGKDTEADFETLIDIQVSAYIPDTYIANETAKLDAYKRIAGIGSQKEYEEMLDELCDRFGDPPAIVMNLLGVARLKAAAHSAYLTEIRQRGNSFELHFYEKARMDGGKLTVFLTENREEISADMKSSAPVLLFTPRRKSARELIRPLEMLGSITEKIAACRSE